MCENIVRPVGTRKHFANPRMSTVDFKIDYTYRFTYPILTICVIFGARKNILQEYVIKNSSKPKITSFLLLAKQKRCKTRHLVSRANLLMMIKIYLTVCTSSL